MVGVDDADAAVLVDVVAGEQQVAHLEAELARRCGPACARPSSVRSPTLIVSPSLSSDVDLARRHRDVDVLRLDAWRRS